MDGNIGNPSHTNLILRPLDDVNDVTWSIVISLIILLVGVFYVIVYILGIDEREAQENGSNDTTKSEELLQLQSDKNK